MYNMYIVLVQYHVEYKFLGYEALQYNYYCQKYFIYCYCKYVRYTFVIPNQLCQTTYYCLNNFQICSTF